MISDCLSNIRVVLVKTTHPGNIGATARAMKTMGLKQLDLVDTCDPLCSEAIARASGADDILQNARRFDHLADSLADCHFAIGTSGRSRTLTWPVKTPEAVMPILCQQAEQQTVAMVFGRERDGLSNEELQQCQYHVCIPTSEDFRSLNLAQAVQILVYECRKVLLATESPSSLPTELENNPASLAKQQGLLQHLEEVMLAVQFLNPAQPRLLKQRMRRLFLRAEPDEKEINIFRGFLAAVQKRLNHQEKTETNARG